jgi:hypothetical protein
VLALLAAGAAFAPPASAGLIGGNFEISGGNCRFPDAAHGSAGGRYLVVWADYNETRIHGRWVSSTGAVDGAPFPISEAGFGALFPAVAYNAAADEFLVTWDDFGTRGELIHGQRVRGDGSLAGANFAIGSHQGGIRSAAAWSAASNVYLVAYWVPGAQAEIYARRVSAAGSLLGVNLNVSADAIFSGYPAIAWGAAGDQFLVSWDNEDGNIHARRVAAATGALAGSNIIVSSGGGKDRSCVAYDPLAERWLVQYNDGASAGFSYDQSGRFVNAQGTPVGAPIPLAHTPAFEGDTQFGGDLCFAPAAGRFFSSFGTDTGMGGQESLASGAPAAPQTVLGSGYYTSLNNAADPGRSRFLTVWEGLDGGTFRVFGQLYAATLGTPQDFAAAAGDGVNSLSWTNPQDPQLTGVVIRFRTDGYPEDPGDGDLLVDAAGSPGAPGSFVHPGLASWTTYYYAAFARDAGPNHSPAARAAATPRPAAITIHASDFDAGAGGWTLEPWRAGTLSPGTVTWDAAARNIAAAGSGATNNQDACTREGGILTRAISTAGRRGIQVEYDVAAALHAPPGASAPGSCAVIEGSGEDKLVVSYSTSGTGGPWTAAQVLSEGLDFPCGWTRRLLNLAGLPAVDDNPNFALRFQWQLNHERDGGRLDAIHVLSGAVTGPEPAIGLSAARLERTVEAGGGLAGDALFVSNTGEGVLEFTVGEDLPWLGVSPAAGASAGPPRRVNINYLVSGLAVGDHEGVITVASANGANSPQPVNVIVHVVPPACIRETFSYYDGDLTVMGGAAWSGDAAGQLACEKGTLTVRGGGGGVSAARPAPCTPAATAIEVRLKIRKGEGTGDFFWNLAIDDDSGDPGGGNLARWYGGSTIVRGRIGGNVTGDLVLSGTEVWDHLRVKIDTAANTSQFFFNEVLAGTIDHGTGPTNRVGAVRIERLDRAGTGGDAIHFDDLVIASGAPPRFHRGDPNASGAADITDAIFLLAYIFERGSAPTCLEAADAQNDGQIDVSDPLAILFHLFAGRALPPPGPPGSPCGPDPDAPGSSRDLGCGRYDACGPP